MINSQNIAPDVANTSQAMTAMSLLHRNMSGMVISGDPSSVNVGDPAGTQAPGVGVVASRLPTRSAVHLARQNGVSVGSTLRAVPTDTSTYGGSSLGSQTIAGATNIATPGARRLGWANGSGASTEDGAGTAAAASPAQSDYATIQIMGVRPEDASAPQNVSSAGGNLAPDTNASPSPKGASGDNLAQQILSEAGGGTVAAGPNSTLAQQILASGGQGVEGLSGTGATAPAYNFTSSTSGGSNGTLIVVVLAVAGLAVWYYLKHRKGSESSSEAA